MNTLYPLMGLQLGLGEIDGKIGLWQIYGILSVNLTNSNLF